MFWVNQGRQTPYVFDEFQDNIKTSDTKAEFFPVNYLSVTTHNIFDDDIGVTDCLAD